MDFATAALAIFALKPLRKHWLHAHVRFSHGEQGAVVTEGTQDTFAFVDAVSKR